MSRNHHVEFFGAAGKKGVRKEGLKKPMGRGEGLGPFGAVRDRFRGRCGFCGVVRADSGLRGTFRTSGAVARSCFMPVK